MTFDQRLYHQIAQHRYPLLFCTTSEHEELKLIAAQCITKHHAHHYLGFSANQWRLFQKETTPRVKPLLYVYRVLLTGIHLMRSGEVESNIVRLNDDFRLPYLPELIDRKTSGPEKGLLDESDLAFHAIEYERLTAILEQAMVESRLPEAASGGNALNDLLIRIRIKQQ